MQTPDIQTFAVRELGRCSDLELFQSSEPLMFSLNWQRSTRVNKDFRDASFVITGASHLSSDHAAKRHWFRLA